MDRYYVNLSSMGDLIVVGVCADNNTAAKTRAHKLAEVHMDRKLPDWDWTVNATNIDNPPPYMQASPEGVDLVAPMRAKWRADRVLYFQ